MTIDDDKYLKYILQSLRMCLHYKPKFGKSKKAGLTLQEFQELYNADPFYQWFGLAHPLMYAAHKAAGGMTSIYRQIGIGCETVFSKVLQDSLGLSDESVKWSYEIPSSSQKKRAIYLDGRVSLEEIQEESAKMRFRQWMQKAAELAKVDPHVFRALKGVIFEVRQGYKSKDSKRQNADIASAAEAYKNGYFPCVILLSNQIDESVLERYKREGWFVLRGVLNSQNPYLSTYDFVKDVVGYDLQCFFERSQTKIKQEIENILLSLLRAEDS